MFQNKITKTVGDALGNILLAEYALVSLGLTLEDWANLYADYPSLTTKVKVSHKHLLKTNY